MRMLVKAGTISAVVENWLADFEKALAAPGDADLRALFPPDCHWRDVLALTWTIQTLSGRDAVVTALKGCAARARPKGFRIAANRTPPRWVTRAGTKTIEAIVAFETSSSPRSTAGCPPALERVALKEARLRDGGGRGPRVLASDGAGRLEPVERWLSAQGVEMIFV